MTMTVQQIVTRQEEILQAMGGIRAMERGTLSRQSYAERAKRKSGQGAAGPYHLWQGTVEGRRFGQRVSGTQAQQIEAGIAQRHAFEALCKEYVDLGCRRAALGRQGAASKEALKKGLKSRSSKARK